MEEQTLSSGIRISLESHVSTPARYFYSYCPRHEEVKLGPVAILNLLVIGEVNRSSFWPNYKELLL